ncbi:MAG: GNAT family acetyltransferase [Lachnospiraceae bacterium]|nr:GNAT family acetyltransferase [Lachnospiraceae bacterium]
MITKMGMPFGGLAKAGFTGSHKGMRFFVKSFEEGKITAYVYPEPYSFPNTPDEDKISRDFEYTHEGVDECLVWLNQMYDENYAN